MTKVELRRPGEKLNEARRALMAPHSGTELQSFAEAVALTQRALERLDPSSIRDERALDWIATLEGLTTSDDDDLRHGDGGSLERARSLSVDDMARFAEAVDELANWLAREHWSTAR